MVDKVLDARGTIRAGRVRTSSRTRTAAHPPLQQQTALIVQHGDHAPAGALTTILSEHGFRSRTCRLDRGERLPDPASANFGLVVVLGADGSARDMRLPWVPAEVAWLERIDRAGMAAFAIGSGAHVLAVALGGDSAPALHAQHGWAQVETVDSDVPAGPWLMWDVRAIQPPPDSELLAYDRVGVKAFRHGRHLGVQFHPEATPEIVRGWSRRGDHATDPGSVDSDTAGAYPAGAYPAAATDSDTAGAYPAATDSDTAGAYPAAAIAARTLIAGLVDRL